MEYIREKALKVILKTEEIDKLVNDHAKGWKTGRMNKVDLSILRLALYEMRWDEEIPESVAINEASWRSWQRAGKGGHDTERVYGKAGKFLYKEYVHAGLYAEPYLCQGGSVQL